MTLAIRFFTVLLPGALLLAPGPTAAGQAAQEASRQEAASPTPSAPGQAPPAKPKEAPVAPEAPEAPDRPYLEAAGRVAESLRAAGPEPDFGLARGTAGRVVFFAELARLSRNEAYLEDVRREADRLLAALEPEAPEGSGLDGYGLEEGLAGAAAALARAGEAAGDERYLDGARTALRLIREGSRAAGDGIEWPGDEGEGDTGLAAGSAGIGLALLDLHRRLDRSAAPLSETWNLALAAGSRLVDQARPVPGGLAWLPPGTSHEHASLRESACGTVEAAYFLSHLYGATSEELFIDAALTGVRRLWENGEETARELLTACPHPAAAARLSYRLYRITRDRVWLERAQGLATAGLEGAATSCEAAEAMGFLLDLDRAERRPEHRSAARQLAGDFLRTLKAGDSLCGGRTGLEDGAAGVGLFLLRLDAAETGRRMPSSLPHQQF